MKKLRHCHPVFRAFLLSYVALNAVHRLRGVFCHFVSGDSVIFNILSSALSP